MTIQEIDLYEEIVRLRRAGEPAVLATIIRQTGSTPRKDAAKMLIRSDGSSVGSIGGGCVEGQIGDLAREVIQSGQPRIFEYEMTDEDLADDGLVCGGSVEIFLEPIQAVPQLIILGGGHVGQAVSELAARTGFRVTVIDDREGFVSEDRFPTAWSRLVRPFDADLQDLDLGTDSYLLIVTRGHLHDETALENALRQVAPYVGMIGSRRKIKLLVDNLLEKGVAREEFRRLYAPIGLDVAAETPAEIAVSVVAELIAFRKGVHARSKKQEFVQNYLFPDNQESA